MSLREGCKEVLKADCVDLAERLYRGQRRGVKVEDEQRCAICAGNIVQSRGGGGVVVFFCHHIYHHKCLRSGTQKEDDKAAPESPVKQVATAGNEEDKLWCTLCQNQKRGRPAKTTTTGRKLGMSNSIDNNNK
jgi:hypothetical protein